MSLLLCWSALMALAGPYTHAKLVAYNCQGNNKKVVSSFDMFNSHECMESTERIEPQTQYILVFHEDFGQVAVRQCKVRRTYLKTGCGQRSHMYTEPDGFSTETMEVSKKTCEEMHSTLTIKMDDQTFKLKKNQVNIFNYIRGSSVTADGTCSDYWKPVNQIILEVTLTSFAAEVNRHLNELYLPSWRATYNKWYYYDPIFGAYCWKALENDCRRSHYRVLYKGRSSYYFSKTYNKTVFYFKNKGEEFAFPVTDSKKFCDVVVYNTIYLNIFINKGDKAMGTNDFRFRVTERVAALPGVELDFLQERIKYQECLAEMLQKQLLFSLAIRNPEEFAYNTLGQVGYTSMKVGEVIHLYKCEQVTVEIRETSKCYDMLPVAYNNADVFIDTKTHVIKENATEVDCFASELPSI